MPGVAADMGAGQQQLLADEMDQQGAGFDKSLDRFAIDRHLDKNLLNFRHFALSSECREPAQARSYARRRARSTMTPAILVR